MSILNYIFKIFTRIISEFIQTIFPLLDKIIEYSFYLLFFLTPLVLTTVNYELFEYNKMLLIYIVTIIIVTSWLIKIIATKNIKFVKTPFDVPIILFLISQIISTIFSLDRYTSIWGYYSRFNGGLVSTICYILLFISFVNNFPKKKIIKLITLTLISGLLVSIYGIAEHFGIDAKYWIQDVQNRVFSTLGQPNWLAAYLAILIPIATGMWLLQIPIIDNKYEEKNQNRKSEHKKINQLAIILPLLLCTLSLIFYITLLFTKSRSGFIGLWVCNTIYWIILVVKFKKNIFKSLIIFNFLLLILNFAVGFPIDQLNKYSLPNLLSQKGNIAVKQQAANTPSLDTGITESGDIRKIVWKGAIEIAKNYPIFGSGVETFAYSYYQFRPIEHNLTSEWDFLYNKAHNEYLNILANTGFFGLLTYLLFIIVFIVWSLKKVNKLHYSFYILHFSLFAGWFSILISNFFGFSVVVVALLFFLIPAISFVFFYENNKGNPMVKNQKVEIKLLNSWQKINIILVIILAIILEFKIVQSWIADYYFSKGYNGNRQEEFISAYNNLEKAVFLNKSVPLYHDELSYAAASLARLSSDQKQATLAGQLASEAIKENSIVLRISPNNVNYWKTAAKVYFSLSYLNESYLKNAVTALKEALKLAPTDPKIIYNLGILYARIGNNDIAIETLKEAVRVKPNYKEARYALAVLYQENKEYEKAKTELKIILEKIDHNDKDVQKKLEEINKKH